MRRRLAVPIFGWALVFAANAPAQGNAPAAEGNAPTAEEASHYETPEAASRFEFRWDALVRYDDIQLSRQAPAPNIYRWRTEVRPELDWMASDRFRLGVRVVGDLGSDANATNSRLFDNYRSNGVGLDRAYLEAKPGNFLFFAGQFAMPLRTTEMFWDHDVAVLGGSGAWRVPIGGMSALTFAGGFFYGPQRQHDQSHIGAGQATWEIGDPQKIAFDWSESYWRFTHLDRTAGSYLRQNEPAAYAPPGVPAPYANDFRILDSLARVRFELGRFPVAVSADWAHNFGASEKQYRDAVEASIRIGREGSPGDVQLFEIYQYVDRDALVGAYNTDDWWFHSWYVGHRVGISVTVLSQVEVRPSVVFQRRQDRQQYLYRYLLDLVKTF